MQKKQLNKIKIIGGKYKGKVINFSYKEHDDSHLRPTSNRARETLFNWLMYDINNSRCLDLFAGSGALSFESLSRNANHITCLELNNDIYKNLISISNSFKDDSGKINIINDNCINYIERTKALDPYDVIFIDPPYKLIDKNFLNKLFSSLKKNNYISNDSLFYLESDKNLELDLNENNINIIKSKKISSVYIYLCNLK